MKTVDKITLYLGSSSSTPLAKVREALVEAGADAQSNARRWLALGMVAEQMGCRLSGMDFILPAGGNVVASSVMPVVERASQNFVARMPEQDKLNVANNGSSSVSEPLSAHTSRAPQASGLMANLRGLSGR
jgi:hypothetical protein